MSNTTITNINCNDRFNFSPSNFSLFPPRRNSNGDIVVCPPIEPLQFELQNNITNPNLEGKWLVGDNNFNLTGGPSSLTFLRRYVRKICPENGKVFVIGKWVFPPKPIYRDVSMPKKTTGQLFQQTANKLTKTQKLKYISSRRFNR